MVWFLNDRVLGREIRTSRYTKWRTTVDGASVRQTLGISAVKGYVAAIVDLWSFQKSKGLNSHSNPHGEALNGVLRARARGEPAPVAARVRRQGRGDLATRRR